MKKQVFFLLLIVSYTLSVSSFSQEIDSLQLSSALPFSYDKHSSIDSSKYVKIKSFSPAVGIGPGMLTFYGDVNDKKLLSPSLSRIGYHINITEHINNYSFLNFYTMFGKLAVNERGPRHLNFESSIRAGGFNIGYNFNNLLPQKRNIDPFIIAGLEAFEFLSKTDMFDASGNKYYYWSNGSIKNIDENAPNAANAISLIKDYSFETDIRMLNINSFGKYSEYSFAVPVGAGFTFYITDRWTFKLGATMHFTFTDYIDGVTDKNKGLGAGDIKKDKFLETYFTLNFSIFSPKPPFVSSLTDEDFLAMENEDEDKDGITDFADNCAGTPEGVTFDAGGCPPDNDFDGVPDYADKEPNSPNGALVNAEGITMDDSTIARNFRIWSDSTGEYINYKYVVNPPVIAFGPGTSAFSSRREFTVLLGSYKIGVTPEEMDKLLNVSDVRSAAQRDSVTAYIAGLFTNISDAEKRKKELAGEDFPNAKVVTYDKNGNLIDVTDDMIKVATTGEAVISHEEISAFKDVVFRVQLGAYSRKLSKSIFKGSGNIIIFRTEDSLYKYMSGSFTNIQDALKHHDEMLKRGYKGAFIVAYKNNKRVTLSSVSGGIIQKNESINELKKIISAVDKKLIFFRVQVGNFVSEPTEDIIKKMRGIQGLEKIKKTSGITQYLTEKSNDYQSAQKLLEDIVKKHGITDAFIVAYFKDEIITIQEAMELLK
ncbi:MAG: hypothetical protein V1781_00710 [Bacteroidota bacterium]